MGEKRGKKLDVPSLTNLTMPEEVTGWRSWKAGIKVLKLQIERLLEAIVREAREVLGVITLRNSWSVKLDRLKPPFIVKSHTTWLGVDYDRFQNR